MFATTPITLNIPLRPASFVVLDLETGDAPAEAVAAATAAWKGQSNWKPETVEEKRAEAAKKIAKKAALLDASPILCTAIQTERDRSCDMPTFATCYACRNYSSRDYETRKSQS